MQTPGVNVIRRFFFIGAVKKGRAFVFDTYSLLNMKLVEKALNLHMKCLPSNDIVEHSCHTPAAYTNPGIRKGFISLTPGHCQSVTDFIKSFTHFA